MQGNTRTWSPLRIAVLVAALAGAAFWIGSVVTWWNVPQARRDGFELMGLALSTGLFALMTLPALILAVIGRWLPFAAALAICVVVLVSDTLMPWVPWDRLPGPP